MIPGDTFLPGAPGAHLNIVAAGPCAHGQILVVKVTADDEPSQDRSCLLAVGDHPYLSKPSRIAYWDDALYLEALGDAAVVRGDLKPMTRVSADLLARIVAGYRISRDARPLRRRFATGGQCACP